jgi:hypothetical protein
MSDDEDKPNRVELLIAKLDAPGNQVLDGSPESFASTRRRHVSSSKQAREEAKSHVSGFRASLRSAVALVKPSTISKRASGNVKQSSLARNVVSRLSRSRTSTSGSCDIDRTTDPGIRRKSAAKSSENPLFVASHDSSKENDKEGACNNGDDDDDEEERPKTALGVRWALARALLADDVDGVLDGIRLLSQFELSDMHAERAVADESSTHTSNPRAGNGRNPYVRTKIRKKLKKERLEALQKLPNDSKALAMVEPDIFDVDSLLVKHLPSYSWDFMEVRTHTLSLSKSTILVLLFHFYR